jgi:16S rRNA G1207 methylase RsmC
MQQQLTQEEFPFPEIYAAEVNDRALWLLNRNKNNNHCDHLRILEGDFREAGKELATKGIQFDVIYSNPPLKVGHEVLLGLFDQAMTLLKPHGFIQYVHKKKLGAPGFLKKLQKMRPSWKMEVFRKTGGYHVIVLAPHDLPFEPQKSSLTGYF